MFNRFRSWLIDNFLPAWAKESVYRENKALREEISALRVKLQERDAFIDGLERGIRTQRRIIIKNEVKK